MASSRDVERSATIGSWPEIVKDGHQLGTDGASVTMMVFSDFQCPVCARFANEILPQLRGRYPTELSIRFRHSTLDGHQRARAAARAAECAGAQGNFAAFHDRVFAQQSQLGDKSFRAWAVEAGSN